MLKPKILLISDDCASRLLLKALLTDGPQADEYEVLTAAADTKAVREVLQQAHGIALILLDINKPDADGFKTAALVREHPHAATAPVIFITPPETSEAALLQRCQHGAVDYLISPVIPQILYGKIAVFIELAKKYIQLQLQKEALTALHRDLQVQQMEELKRIHAALETEINERRQAEQRANRLATRDSLTGLMNRRSLNEHLEHALNRAARQDGELALLFLDMDRFKNVNDTLGHDAADQLLQKLAARLGKIVRSTDIVARVGGDEFVVLMEGTPSCSAPAAAEVAKKIVKACTLPFRVGGESIRLSASIGISLYPQDGSTAQELMRNANLAMCDVKQERRGGMQFFHEELNERMIERSQLEQELQQALERGEFELYYQPKVEASSGRIAGVEALLRWHHPRHGLLSGGQFLTAATDTGQVVKIGEWVISAACAQARIWQQCGKIFPEDMPIAVNIATPQLYADLPEVIGRALRKYNVPPSSLQLEITESLLIGDVEKAASVLREISDSGITIAIDDFGTGYSSLSVLKSLPINVLKIDQSFVRDLGKDLGDHAIVEAIVNMARALTLHVVAEGVETYEQWRILQDIGCDEHQGYYYSKPLPAHMLAAHFTRV